MERNNRRRLMLLQTLRTRDFDELVAAFPSKRTSQAPPLLPPLERATSVLLTERATCFKGDKGTLPVATGEIVCFGNVILGISGLPSCSESRRTWTPVT